MFLVLRFSFDLLVNFVNLCIFVTFSFCCS